jgi:hypothetical protein
VVPSLNREQNPSLSIAAELSRRRRAPRDR